MQITKPQMQQLHALLPSVIKSNPQQKQLLVTKYTGNPKLKSTKDLSFDQANEIIKQYGGKPLTYDNWAWFDSKKNQHRYILSLLNQLGWNKYDINLKRHTADLYRFSEWLKSNKSPVQLPLKKMTPKQTSIIISALESMLSKTLKKV